MGLPSWQIYTKWVQCLKTTDIEDTHHLDAFSTITWGLPSFSSFSSWLTFWSPIHWVYSFCFSNTVGSLFSPSFWLASQSCNVFVFCGNVRLTLICGTHGFHMLSTSSQTAPLLPCVPILTFLTLNFFFRLQFIFFSASLSSHSLLLWRKVFIFPKYFSLILKCLPKTSLQG